ncbi:MAG: hypothetical protein ACPG5P_08610, partial [Saprospiraceae bacterium]
FLRKELQFPAMLMSIVIDAALAPKTDKPIIKKLLTRKEKLAQMFQQNPKVKDLWERMDLKYDE